MPRHSPYALLSLNSFVYQSIYCSLNCCVPRFLQLLFASAKIAFTLFGKTWFLHLLFPLLFKKPVRVCFFLFGFQWSPAFCGKPCYTASKAFDSLQILLKPHNSFLFFSLMGTWQPQTWAMQFAALQAHIQLTLNLYFLPDLCFGGLKWTRTTDLALIRRAL